MTPLPTRARRSTTGALALLALALAPGSFACSFKVIRPAPPPSTWPDPVVASSSQERCTSTMGIPAADTVITAGLGTLTYIERDAGSRAITIGIGAATIPFLVSAIYGYVETARCKRYQARFETPQN
jgi:hypothetical protein